MCILIIIKLYNLCLLFHWITWQVFQYSPLLLKGTRQFFQCSHYFTTQGVIKIRIDEIVPIMVLKIMHNKKPTSLC
jgi:hypothetical protein